MTKPTGRRLTEPRVAELRSEIAETRGALEARIAGVERRLDQLAELPVEIARAQASALLSILKTRRESDADHA